MNSLLVVTVLNLLTNPRFVVILLTAVIDLVVIAVPQLEAVRPELLAVVSAIGALLLAATHAAHSATRPQ